MAVQVNDNGVTPTKTFSYDQLDRQVSAAIEGAAAYRYVYNERNQITEEQITIPTVNGNLERSLIRSYDSHGRPIGYQLKNGDTVEQTLSYTYTPTGQLAGVSADGKEFTYSYLPDMPKLIAQTSSPLHTVTHVYEANRDVLTSKTNRWKNKVDNPIISAYTYTVNNLGQRTSVATEGEAFASAPADWAWGYDVLGQVISANEDHYSYDQIGNRRTSRKGDAADTVYTANALNQYSRIGTTVPTHDADGNQLTGLTPTTTVPARDTLSFTYNAENRPVNVGQNGEVRESYSYDHMGRRIHKGDTVTLYDGYNAIAEYKSNTRTLKTTYAWGNDLSGTAQGDGGVGGLLTVTEYDRQVPLTSYPCYDGNGNITEYLTEESAGTIAAHYEYDAFGQVSRKTGSGDYSYQFSTKPNDFLTGLLYYNYRYYDPKDGRWITRDPISEQGGVNLYGFINNKLLSYNDYIGLLAVGDKIDVLCPLKEKEQGAKEKIGVIEILQYQEVVGNVVEPSGREIIGGGVNFEIVFKLDEENKSKERCCCKDKKFQWIQTVEKDNSPTRPQDAPYPDGTAIPYYRANPGDPPRLFDAPIEPAENLFPINSNGPYWVEVILKTRLVCASEENKEYAAVTWGFSFAKGIDGEWSAQKL